MLKFPPGFLWGAATSSYQVEGGIEGSDWAAAARKKKVPPAGAACDHYRLFEEDFDIAKSLGHNAHRFSVEWARIEPSEGQFDAKELEHYRGVIAALRARDITPMITLWHFTLPLWLSEKGGALHPDFPHYFRRYCLKVVDSVGAPDILFVTINEPGIFASMGFIRGAWPPYKT